MKLLVLAHTPPPFHGQSYMVRILLDALAQTNQPPPTGPAVSTPADRSIPQPLIQCVHVDFRLSNSIEDIGQRPWVKLGLLLKYCLQAIWIRIRGHADTLFYIPAPGLRNALYRDWLVMLCCRPFFRRRVYWWQAADLGAWLKSDARPWERRLTRLLLGRPDLSIVMGSETEQDARELCSLRTAVVPNAIPDPCPADAAELVRTKSQLRAVHAQQLEARVDVNPSPAPQPRFRLLFISLCHREKGLFDAVEALALVNRHLTTTGARLRVELDVAGRFYLPTEQSEFEERIRQPDLLLPAETATNTPPDAPSPELVSAVRYHGFAGGAAKDRLFRDADCLVFPTYYAAESFGLVLLEAMAYGLDIIATRWRNIPELLPPGHPTLVNPKDPADVANAIQRLFQRYHGDRLRRHYEQFHSVEGFREKVTVALLDLEPARTAAPTR
jgi:glycosyltransferase involved in cell wall biosynthesis